MAIQSLPSDLEDLFSTHVSDPQSLLTAFMPLFCDHVLADRIFLQPRNPDSRVCKIIRWRRHDKIPWPEIPGQLVDEWFIEEEWEKEDPLWRAALALKPSIYIENLSLAAEQGILNLDFEAKYMFHTAFIHGHAHWPPISAPESESGERKFYGSVQPAVFDGPRIWTGTVRALVEKCLVRIAPVMKAVGESAPSRESVEGEGG